MARRPKTLLAFALAVAAGSGQAWAAAPAPGRPETVREDPDEGLQWAAGVVRIDELRRQGDLGGKLFGTAGGDPAMNGLYTYLAFFESAGDGWRVFRLGDFVNYRILAETPGRVTLQIEENFMNDPTGEIGTRARRLLVSWRPGPVGTPPTSVQIAIAR